MINGRSSHYINPFKTKITHSLINTLLSKCTHSNWVEIENEFYEQLKLLLPNYVDFEKSKKEKLDDLNQSMKYLISQLEEYLSQERSTFSNNQYIDILKSHRYNLKKYDQNSNNKLLVLNFNYTDTIERYLDHKEFKPFKSSSSVIQIHGQLNNPKNPIIFGFGDELDSNYKKIEEDRTKGFFKHIKSFGYFKTSNYANLVKFVDSNKYEVVILGHSCGLSDRTMLHMIFENDNCDNIKIYYHKSENKNNFIEITEEISRHFDNKEKMRRRVLSFDKCEPMPQV